MSIEDQHNAIISTAAKGMIVNLKNIDMPFLNIIAKHDDLVGPSSSKSLDDVLTKNRDKDRFEFKSGHVGLIQKRLTKNYGQRWENG
jgi:poly(3-hydroxyalkanoate) synthetase